MFRILSLLLIFQRAKSYNTSLVHRYNIIVTKTTMEPTSCINMRLTFHVGKEVEHLNGQFSVYHGGQGLGKANYKPPVRRSLLNSDSRLARATLILKSDLTTTKTAASRRTRQAGQPKHLGTAVLIWHRPQHQHHHHQHHHHQQS